MKRLLTINDRPGAYPDSYYAASANHIDPFPGVDQDLSCDVCIVGAGYTGLSAALHLAQRGYDTVLVDANRVGWGASGRNGGQVNSGQRRGQTHLEKLVGPDHAWQLWELGQAAKALVKDLVSRHHIDCAYKSGIINAVHRQRYVSDSHRYVDKLRNEYGYDQIRALSRDEIRQHLATDYYYGGSIDMGAAHLHPLNYALGITRAAVNHGARIYERSEVVDVEEGAKCRVRLSRGQVTADFVVLACNGYLDGLNKNIAARVMPINNFIIATEPLPESLAREIIRDDVAVSDSKFVINYYRLSQDRRLLFGGGETYRYRFPKDIKSFVRPYMLEVYPQLQDIKIDFGWGGTLAITMRRLPYFTRLSRNVLTASGYSGQGVAIATLAGQVLAETIAGTSERFDVMRNIPTVPFPGGPMVRWPLLVLAMTYFSLRDKI